jgi:hypothetical protein
LIEKHPVETARRHFETFRFNNLNVIEPASEDDSPVRKDAMTDLPVADQPPTDSTQFIATGREFSHCLARRA